MKNFRLVKIVLVATLFTSLLSSSANADAKYPGTPGGNVSKTTIKTLVISFDRDVAKLSNAQLLQILAVAKLKNTTFKVSGYASQAGNASYSMNISKIRAESIAKQIKEYSPKAKITTQGYGTLKNSACKKYNNRCVVITATTKK